MKYFINRTFSFLGTEKQCRHFHRSLGKTKFTIENSDFVGEKDEFHSGSFTEEIKLDGENKLVDLVRLYIQDETNEMRGECFSIVDEQTRHINLQKIIAMKVKDHNKYRLFNYTNDLSNKNFELGQVVINEDNEIGVVIQLHEDGDCRTDMFGNTSLSEVKTATKNEIKQYREELLNDLI